jgi:polar amino acid transport system substrate-binding protein
MNVRIKLGVVAASVAALALSACGSSSLSGEPGGGAAPSVSVSQNVDLASKLPESIKNAGVIKIGTDSTYAPNEFLAADGKTVQGFDVDLFNAVAAKFGVKTSGKHRSSAASSPVSTARNTTWASHRSRSTRIA